MAINHSTGEPAEPKDARRQVRKNRKNFTYRDITITRLVELARKLGTSENTAIEDAVASAAKQIPILPEIAATAEQVQEIITRAPADDKPKWVNVAELFGTTEGDYLWKVRGSSMSGGNVREGDYLLIRPQSTCDSGEEAIVMVELPTGRRPSLRRVEFNGGSSSVRLVSLHNEKDVISIEGKELEIRGVKRGVIPAN